MVNKKRDTMGTRVRKALTTDKVISEMSSEASLGISGGALRNIVYKLRQEGWTIKLEKRKEGGSAYHLVSLPDSPASPAPVIEFKSYTIGEFREILITLYGQMDDWELSAFAMRDFNSPQLRINRWLKRGKPITGPAVSLADMLIEKHNAKTESKP